MKIVTLPLINSVYEKIFTWMQDFYNPDNWQFLFSLPEVYSYRNFQVWHYRWGQYFFRHCSVLHLLSIYSLKAGYRTGIRCYQSTYRCISYCFPHYILYRIYACQICHIHCIRVAWADTVFQILADCFCCHFLKLHLSEVFCWIYAPESFGCKITHDCNRCGI